MYMKTVNSLFSIIQYHTHSIRIHMYSVKPSLTEVLAHFITSYLSHSS